MEMSDSLKAYFWDGVVFTLSQYESFEDYKAKVIDKNKEVAANEEANR